ncbi:MAG TPA: hypothetical protein VFK97_02290 [Candidatus Saccharimonadales bacterium]|nr:hypothetical protein [Candidatus Saccharimonadales bacterium]
MTATNHALTGAIIAVAIDKPAIALPLAFFSHFAQDAIPHYGLAGHGGYKATLKSRLSKAIMLADPIAFVPLILVLLVHQANFWVYAAAFLALSPDFHDFIAYFVFKKPTRFNWFSKWASTIQWCERPWGIFVEVIWYIGGLALLINLLT